VYKWVYGIGVYFPPVYSQPLSLYLGTYIPTKEYNRL
jgi:hypothetical protein